MALEGTAHSETLDQPTASTSAEGDTASATQPSEQTAAQDRTDEGADEPASDEVKAEFAKVGELLTKLPAPLQKEYRRAITQGFQRAAESGKRYEPYKQLIESLESDPVATIKALSERAGFLQPEPPGKQQTDEVLSELSQIVGEEEAKRLAPAFEKLAKKVLESEIKPLKQHQDFVTAQMAREQAESITKAFRDKHPDSVKYEAKMTQIAQTLKPNGMSEPEYLEALYKLATYDVQSAEQTKKVVEKLNQSAQAADQVASGMNASRVSPTAPKFKDVDEALAASAEAARKGIAW